MVVALATGEAVALYNNLMKLPFSDIEAIARIRWRLQALNRQRPSDIPISVALLQAYLMEGNAPEGIKLASYLWSRRYAITDHVACTYGACLTHLGMYKYASDFVYSHPAVMSDLVGQFALNHSAWGMGDVDKLRLVGAQGTESQQAAWRAILLEMEKAGLLPTLKIRQEIIAKHLFGKQTAFELLLTADDAHNVSLAQSSFVAIDHEGRVELEEAIYADLNSFYSTQDLKGDFWSVAPVVILDIRSRPAPVNEELVPEAA